MKIKPLYLYGGIAVLAISFLIFFTSKDETDFSENIGMSEMPDDQIHKGLNNPVQTPPGKENVSEEFKHKLEMLKKSVDENPDDTLKIREYADLLAAAHRPEEAVIYYYNILDVNPGRTDILFSLAFIYYNKKDYDNAAGVIEKVLLYQPENTKAMFNLGAIAAAKGNTLEAKERWEKLIKEYPDSDASSLAKNSLKKL